MVDKGFWMLIIRKGQAFIPTQARTQSGFYMGVEPIEVVQTSDRPGVEQALLRAIDRGNPPVRTPSLPEMEDNSKSALLKCAKVKSLSAFEKGAERWQLSKHEGAYSIVPYRPHEEGGAVADLKRAERIPGDEPIQAVVRRLVDRALGAQKGGE
jgi:hypothetical protein